MASLLNKINKYLTEVLLFEDYKDKTEVINKIVLNAKIILGFCLSDMVYYFYSIIKLEHEGYLNIVGTLTVCIISGFRILYLLRILKKMTL